MRVFRSRTIRRRAAARAGSRCRRSTSGSSGANRPPSSSRSSRRAPEHARVDPDYFRAAVQAVCADQAGIDAELGRHSDIEPARLDPVEHAILALGLWELMARPEVPYRVVINEGIELAKRFGATDGHRYVNAVLDRASRAHRGAERGEVA